MISFIQSLDMRMLESLFAMRELATVNLLIVITEAGDVVFVAGFVACLSLFLFARHKYTYLVGLVASVAGAAGTMLLLKHAIARPRPDILYHAYLQGGFSLPSGHATLAAALYGFLIYLAWRALPAGLWRIAVMASLGALIAAIAFSRLYLGVHYLSDVIAGVLLGGAFAYIGIFVVRRLENRS